VNDDIDGDPRPQGRGYDVGADEFACTAIVEVTITGPATGAVGTAYTFSATIAPLDATPPMTYTWSPEPESGQGTSNAQYQWASSGVYTLTLAVENCGGSDVTPHTITIEGAYIYLPLVLKN
jgi:PKD repeat protein